MQIVRFADAPGIGIAHPNGREFGEDAGEAGRPAIVQGARRGGPRDGLQGGSGGLTRKFRSAGPGILLSRRGQEGDLVMRRGQHTDEQQDSEGSNAFHITLYEARKSVLEKCDPPGEGIAERLHGLLFVFTRSR